MRQRKIDKRRGIAIGTSTKRNNATNGRLDDNNDDTSPKQPIIDQSISESLDKLTNEIMVQI